jgi:hypothetical protein
MALPYSYNTEFPLDNLDSEDFDPSQFLYSCFREGNISINAEKLRSCLRGELKSTTDQLERIIQKDFDKILQVPGMLQKLDSDLESLYTKLLKVCNSFNLKNQQVATIKSKSKEIISKLISITQQEKSQTKQLQDLLYSSELDNLFSSISEYLSQPYPQIPTKSALFTRASRILSEYSNSGIYKSQFLKFLDTELLRSFDSGEVSLRHIQALLSCYKSLAFASYSQNLISDRLIRPIFSDSISQHPSKSLHTFFHSVKLEMEQGKLKLLVKASAGREDEMLIGTIWRAISGMLSKTKAYTPAFQEEYIQNVQTTLSFCEYFKTLLQNSDEFEKHPLYVEFVDEWNLATYFQLKQVSIVKRLNLMLQMESLDKFLSEKPGNSFWKCIEECWKDLIPQLFPKILRFSFQILSRYVTFTTKHLNSQSKKLGVSLETLQMLVRDVHSFMLQLENLEELIPKIGKDCKEEAIRILSQVKDPCTRCIAEVITGQISNQLEALKTIPASYRMTNRPFPTEPSAFALSFLKPILQLPAELADLSPKIISKTLNKYYEVLGSTLSAICKSDAFLSKYQGNESNTDREKMLAQLKLDTLFFCKQIEEIGYTSEEELQQIKKEIECLEDS